MYAHLYGRFAPAWIFEKTDGGDIGMGGRRCGDLFYHCLPESLYRRCGAGVVLWLLFAGMVLPPESGGDQGTHGEDDTMDRGSAGFGWG